MALTMLRNLSGEPTNEQADHKLKIIVIGNVTYWSQFVRRNVC